MDSVLELKGLTKDDYSRIEMNSKDCIICYGFYLLKTKENDKIFLLHL